MRSVEFQHVYREGGLVNGLGESIAAQRRSIEASQSWLAFKLGVSRTTISNWERGVTEPNSSQLVTIANAFGVSVDDMIHGNRPVIVRMCGSPPFYW